MGSIDLLPERSTPPARRNWNNVEWDKFRTTLNGNLSTLGPARPIEDKDTFSTAFNLLTAAIQSTTDQHVPSVHAHPVYQMVVVTRPVLYA